MQDYGKLSILVVDDSRHMVRLVSAILESFGVGEVYQCEDAAGAYATLGAVPIDIVITDWRMEPTDGLELTRLIRRGEDSPNPFVPIIMLTAHTEKSHVIAARDSGVNEFLAKPVTPEALYKRLDAVISRPRPFIRAKHYFGPDRRRRKDPPPAVDRRAEDSPDASSQDDTVALLDSAVGRKS